jgi:hypothetical protein
VTAAAATVAAVASAGRCVANHCLDFSAAERRHYRPTAATAITTTTAAARRHL